MDKKSTTGSEVFDSFTKVWLERTKNADAPRYATIPINEGVFLVDCDTDDVVAPVRGTTTRLVASLMLSGTVVDETGQTQAALLAFPGSTKPFEGSYTLHIIDSTPPTA